MADMGAARDSCIRRSLSEDLAGAGSGEASQGATADRAVSQTYTMAVAGRGQLVVPGIPASLAAPFLTAVHVLISGHVQSRQLRGRPREPLPWPAMTFARLRQRRSRRRWPWSSYSR